MTETSYRSCSDCGTVTLFAAVPCLDGHGLDCPELACTDCGSAVVLAVHLDEALVLAAAA